MLKPFAPRAEGFRHGSSMSTRVPDFTVCCLCRDQSRKDSSKDAWHGVINVEMEGDTNPRQLQAKWWAIN